MRGRTAEQKYVDMVLRGRTVEEIRAVAVARDDRELLEYIAALIARG